ncbi:sodium channel modifier 1 isoform X1 [Passer domesticus]|uniref:sodium channel modifier 1 isoform X1 n=1 Tax=Passer domesticus TaxID=48849 RepID=UPI0030FEFBC8
MPRGPRWALSDWFFPPRAARCEAPPGSGGGGCHGDRGLAGAAMSFKRDESDPGPLGALQRRRVAELLASAIPEDEALLLRDGRLACSLCPQRPVCDTLQTLLLHRAGRKHLDSAAAGPDAAAGAERAAESGPVQQLLPPERDEGQQLPGRDPRDDPKESPDAAGAVREPREPRESRNPRPHAQRGRSQGQETAKERKFPELRGAEPGAAADPAAPPAPAQPGLDPGSLWELGEGRERRVRLRRGGAATTATSLTAPSVPRSPQEPPSVPRAPGIKWEFFGTISPLHSLYS